MTVLPATSPTAADLWVPQMATIREVRNEVRGIRTYDLELDDDEVAAEYRFEPGQFNMLYLPGIGESAISISSDPAESGLLSHTVRVAGNVTTALTRLGEGDHVGLRGPFGSSWPVDACRGNDVVIACGGLGLPPLRPLIYTIAQQREQFGRVYLLYGARTPDDLLFTAEYEAWRASDIEVEVTVDIGNDDWRGNIGVVPVLFYRLRLDVSRTRVLTCGPEIMMRFVIFEALARRVSSDNIYLSMERNMSCALGFCGHCQLGPAFICKDGPVFTYGQMEPYLHVEDL